MIQTNGISGKRILITGGTTGIGRATTMLLAREGAHILTFGRNEPELADALDAAGLAAEAGLTADAGTREGVDSVFAAVDERLGGLDILVACAALGAKPLHEMAEDDWRYVIDTNLTGYLACARRAIERFDRAGGGHIVVVGSISADIKAPGESVYAATKGGIQAFAETLRKEVASKNIKVTLIEPGSVGSDMQECSAEDQRAAIARGEMLHAEEIAEATLFALDRSDRCDVVSLRIEPLLQKTA
jgi:NAD(P)-dependent dehydrogenase (short-subunit alcohol dehydrogenase family)